MSDEYILNSVGESTPPVRAPVFIVACFDFVLLYCVNCLLPGCSFINSMPVLGMFVCVTLYRSLCKCKVSNAFDISSEIASFFQVVYSC